MFVVWLYGVGEKNCKGWFEWFCIMLEGNVIKFIVWGLNEWFICNYIFFVRVVFKFDIVWDGLLVKFFFEGMKDRLMFRFFDEDILKICFRIFEDVL